MAHKARCANQNNAIEEIHNMMKKKCISSNGYVIVALTIGDYKMKFEPMSLRETTLDHYGKHDISWHGFCVQFYLLQETTRMMMWYLHQRNTQYTWIKSCLIEINKIVSLFIYSLMRLWVRFRTSFHSSHPSYCRQTMQSPTATHFSCVPSHF